MTIHEHCIARLRRRIGVLLAVRHVAMFLAAWAFLWGTAVVVLRVALAVAPLDLLWGLAAVPVLIGLAAVLALRRLPAADNVRALLDRESGAGGLLLAAEERELGGWADVLPPAPRLRVRWHGGPAWAFLGAGALFLATSLLVPQQLVSLIPGHGLEIGAEVARLTAQLEVLKETAVLEPARAESLEQKLGQLKEHASGEDPAKTLEALDHVQNVASRAAQEAAESAVQKTERLARAETLAEGLSQAAGEIEPRLQAEAMAELAGLAANAAAENKILGKGLDAQALKDCKAGTLSPDQLKKLAEALRGARKDLAGTLEKLRRANLIDLEALAKCERAGRCNCTGMARLLKEGGKESVRAMLSRCQNPGRGGPEGGGPAELTWGEPSSEEGTKFKEEALPPAAVAALRESRLVGLGTAPPSVEKSGGPSQPGALGQAAPGAGSAHTQVVLPRHRGAVERYFERAAGK